MVFFFLINALIVIGDDVTIMFVGFGIIFCKYLSGDRSDNVVMRVVSAVGKVAVL